MKAIVAHHDLSGPASALEAIRAARVEDAATKTLGTLVGQLFGSYVVTDLVAEEELDGPGVAEVATVRMRLQLSMGAEDYQRTQADLRDLVALRNGLVHHFIDHHDLWSVQGCRSAQEALVGAYTRIDQHYEQLRGWAEHMDQARRLAAEFAQSSAFHELVVNGIAPDGSIDWAASGIVRALREAMVELAEDGWTPAAKAGRWVQAKYPDQVPAKYGCSSWRQVLHESRLFELRYREVDGQRAGYYRERGV
ncbi:TPA: OST-HTH/LOTUS domain-containing protein [Pseudomonas putida]|nr:OST-HTH/LOTUS domain-containing protein [Pseudomonas putida]HDS1799931.1 OST-HTH/LOTUS domain-containing protein [Pseudomonas putida]HDS1806325.1 OST-HTH/LOTUS domain-containing protein [Pseudomonas putida]